jgi:hypothetical protein
LLSLCLHAKFCLPFSLSSSMLLYPLIFTNILRAFVCWLYITTLLLFKLLIYYHFNSMSISKSQMPKRRGGSRNSTAPEGNFNNKKKSVLSQVHIVNH